MSNFMQVCLVACYATFLGTGEAAASMKSYQTCFQAYVNVTGYLGWAKPSGLRAERAAFEVDFERFVAMGIERYGERAVRAMVPDPEEDFIDSTIPIHAMDGVEKTTALLLDMVAPCGGPDGELRAFYPM
ncbi:hypothetical protein GVY41_18960 [Frigidibacter albus]|uniref:Uncharacterized protein n=1 Tax=Frigidibacter albus TaxID=1465486 RepID=A0A6L8VMX7_9RHOB|nr:hypothetical protein [Frigidibacter albus]MZQ91156.1 hypothetical protein [Frigidibacter albus]NBE33082.1 hypothetical protein [Frigidibacter albus]GGH63180.1 hypothetical protein GCM10011341_38080 [Frigidibacter albus]